MISIVIGNPGIPILIVTIVKIILIIINNRVAKLDKQQAGNSVKVYFTIKYSRIAPKYIEILLLSYVSLSAKTCIVYTTSEFFFSFSKHYLQCLKSGYFQLNQASSFEVIALNSRASKKIDLYSNHTENKLQALTFPAIT